MKHKIIKSLIIVFFTIGFVSCDNKESVDSVFNQTAVERINLEKINLENLLESSEFGWKLFYLPDSTQVGGYVHLFKFKNGIVDMASDFDDDTEVYKSAYDIEIGSTLSLVFTTKNRIHLLSDPNLSPTSSLVGKGYKGDFQFLYYGQEKGQIVFKTNRGFQDLRFVKATMADWENISKNIVMENTLKGQSYFKLLQINNGTEIRKYDFVFPNKTRYITSKPRNQGSVKVIKMGITYNPEGFTANPAIVVNGQQLSTFLYNAIDSSFVASGTAGVSAMITSSHMPPILTDDYKVLLRKEPLLNFFFQLQGRNFKTDSKLFDSEVAKVNEALPASDYLRVIILYVNGSDARIVYRTLSGGDFQHFVNIKEDVTEKKVLLTHEKWSKNPPAAIANFDKRFVNSTGLFVKKETVGSIDFYTLTSFKNSTFFTTLQSN